MRAKRSEKIPNQGKPWSEDDDALLIDKLSKGRSWLFCGRLLGRTMDAIRNREDELKQKGLIG